ncbi:MAG: GNAT family N-acetyltransferase [candidate division NC10 bacterium]
MIEYEFVRELPTEAVAVLYALYRAAGWWEEDPEARGVIPRMIRGSLCFLVAKSEEARVVGMGRVISDGVSDAYIQDVVVRAEYRRRGIGRAIIGRLVKYCTERGISWVGLVAEPGTQDFYRTLDFREKPGFELMLLDEGRG